MENWQRVVATTIAKFIRGEEVNVLRSRKLLSLLQSRGRITFNHSGTNLDWKVRYKRAPMTGYQDGDLLTFSRQNRHKTATIDWRGYSATDQVTKMEREQNKGAEAIIKIYDNVAKLLMEDIQEQFGDELFIDGNATGNGKRIHGLESMFGTSGAAAAGYIATPSDTYAGLSTIPGNYGGSWSQNGSSQVTWPIGTGSPEYDFWSPLIIDYTDASWAATTDTFINTCIEALRFAITHAGRNKTMRGQLDAFILDPELYRQFAQAQETKQSIQIRRGDKAGGLVALGFTDVINFDGVDVTREYGIPVEVGYGVNIESMELCSLQGQLFMPEGPDRDISTKSDRFSIDFLGNMKMNPRNFSKLDSVS